MIDMHATVCVVFVCYTSVCWPVFWAENAFVTCKVQQTTSQKESCWCLVVCMKILK